jgi:hypothetical protein
MSICVQILQGMHSLYAWRDKKYVSEISYSLNLLFRFSLVFIYIIIKHATISLQKEQKRLDIETNKKKMTLQKVWYPKNDC